MIKDYTTCTKCGAITEHMNGSVRIQQKCNCSPQKEEIIKDKFWVGESFGDYTCYYCKHLLVGYIHSGFFISKNCRKNRILIFFNIMGEKITFPFFGTLEEAKVRFIEILEKLKSVDLL